MMKVLHAIDKMDPKRGGVCQAVRTIIVGLKELGIDNEVVSLDAANEKFLANNNYTNHALGPSNNYWSFSRKLVPWLFDNLYKFDVVIVHGLWQYPAYALNRVKRQLEKQLSLNNSIPKLYVMPHGMLDPYFQTASGRKLKAVRNKVYWELMERKSVNNADGILFTCETECVLARVPFKPYKPKQELIVGLGVEAPPQFLDGMKDAFLNKCKSIEKNKYLLFLGRIHEKKGVDILLKAYGELKAKEDERRKKRISCSFSSLPKLVIAGPGLDTEYGRKIREMILENNILRDNVLLTGMLSGDAKWGAFYGCDAFILASHQENFGIAVVEAMACGKPVLITNKINIYREIKSAGAGIISEDTFQGMSNSLKIWSSMHNSKKENMQDNALKCYERNFAVHAASKRLMEVLSS